VPKWLSARVHNHRTLILHSSCELDELSQWLGHGESTISIGIDIIRPHCPHAVHEMRLTATDGTHICCTVSISACWVHGWSVQKLMNQSWCRLLYWLKWVQGTMH